MINVVSRGGFVLFSLTKYVSVDSGCHAAATVHISMRTGTVLLSEMLEQEVTQALIKTSLIS